MYGWVIASAAVTLGTWLLCLPAAALGLPPALLVSKAILKLPARAAEYTAGTCVHIIRPIVRMDTMLGAFCSACCWKSLNKVYASRWGAC
jgi:hypothetical protein